MISDRELLYAILNDVSGLNREVGEIKATLKEMQRVKTIGYTKIGLLMSAGVLVGELAHMFLGAVIG